MHSHLTLKKIYQITVFNNKLNKDNKDSNNRAKVVQISKREKSYEYIKILVKVFIKIILNSKLSFYVFIGLSIFIK